MFTIKVYIDDGIVFEYDVETAEQVRDHADAIVKGGYQHNDGEQIFVHFPPHRINRVKCEGQIPTKYPDRVSGT